MKAGDHLTVTTPGPNSQTFVYDVKSNAAAGDEILLKLQTGSSAPGLDSGGHLDLQEIANALNVKEFASTDNWHFKLESHDTSPAFGAANKDFTGWDMDWDAPAVPTNRQDAWSSF